MELDGKLRVGAMAYVKPQQIVLPGDSADGGLATKAAVTAMPVVVVQPAGECRGSLDGGVVGHAMTSHRRLSTTGGARRSSPAERSGRPPPRTTARVQTRPSRAAHTG